MGFHENVSVFVPGLSLWELRWEFERGQNRAKRSKLSGGLAIVYLEGVVAESDYHLRGDALLPLLRTVDSMQWH